MDFGANLTSALLIADLIIRSVLSVRVIMRGEPPQVTLAWLVVILVFPFAGALLYLLIGENRLGSRRVAREREIAEPYLRRMAELRAWDLASVPLPPAAMRVARTCTSLTGIPVLHGNSVELFPDPDPAFDALIADIDRAERTCHLETFIWFNGGRADDVARALVRAARRGVVCRVLADAVGSRAFLASQTAREMRAAGVQLVSSLPVGVFRLLLVRQDLRNHRKLLVVDGQVAYLGSLNVADPRCFKLSSGCAPWVDVMARMTGPAVEAAALSFLEDWHLDTGDGLEQLGPERVDLRHLDRSGETPVQLVPSGPGRRRGVAMETFVAAIDAAERELIITTPYFVPDAILLGNMLSAARRGVDVTLIIPEKVDSAFAHWASRSNFQKLFDAGAKVAQYRGGLLHTKSITADGHICYLGTTNMDARSCYLNYELGIFAYDEDLAGRVRELQVRYLANCTFVDPPSWRARPVVIRFWENVVSLMGPLI